MRNSSFYRVYTKFIRYEAGRVHIIELTSHDMDHKVSYHQDHTKWTMVHDNCILRDERDENEIKRLAELHFEQRKEDDAKLDELANLIETTKQV